MAKFKVLNRFKDLEQNKIHEKDDTIDITVKRAIDITVKRANEIKDKLKSYDRPFLERIPK
ncbi:hypothetical protein JCM2421_14650 [Staphylococcus auricularis]|uniref:Uncharacterized protein n=1 Tax=Staphylococcus auricularis TaxID=29379 RepID=A0AAP8PN02_9STAP|nr:hypothetical protein [Staphylococcus auricularis]PNZ66490.1 hypothetical protein CD158_08390 [Staphylococcus auricularis]QPT06852.1 hypothetical protein I6G39_04385 [Staphylococcus auricularis]BCU52693.1 hypothetical protein JCM2421_14650 [Staphylococcus auricularis]SQJ13768.1 Uncharacterised protein [Staphylococcus auricularis]